MPEHAAVEAAEEASVGTSAATTTTTTTTTAASSSGSSGSSERSQSQGSGAPEAEKRGSVDDGGLEEPQAAEAVSGGDASGTTASDPAAASALDTSVGSGSGSGSGAGDAGWKVGPEDFTLLCVIGQGAFGRVLQVRSKFDQEVYAMKVISKRMLKKKNHLSYMRAERDIMTKVDFPFVVGLKFSFQTEEKLFLVMNYLPGGELFFHLRKQGLILEDTARFYGAELVLALEHLHSKGIIHRDLKPENVLVDRHGHLCLTDFGLAKELNAPGSGSGGSSGSSGTGGGEGEGGDGDEDGEEGGRTRTVCGTNEYMCPEMILRKGYGKAADWWSLGALMYEMMAGQPPFRAKAAKELNRKILHEKLSLPKWLTSDAHAVLRGLLERNVQKRLGAARSTMFELGGVAALKAHRFFAAGKGIDWQALLRKQLPAPVVPELSHEADTSNFDEEFTKMDLSLSLVEIERDAEATHSDTFHGFSFIEASVPLPKQEPAYKAQARADRAARRLQPAADPDLFDGDGPAPAQPSSAKKKKKKKAQPGAGSAPAVGAASTTAAVAAVAGDGATTPGAAEARSGVTGAGSSPVPGDAAADGPDADAATATTKARIASIAESGVEPGPEKEPEPEDGVDKTLRLLQAAAAAGAAARRQQQEEQEQEQQQQQGVSAGPAKEEAAATCIAAAVASGDFPPLGATVAAETQPLPPPARPTASAWASAAAGGVKSSGPIPVRAEAAAGPRPEPVRREQAGTPPIKQEPAPVPAPATKPAFSWSAVVAKHGAGTPTPASAPASPMKQQPGVPAAKASGAPPSSLASSMMEEEQEDEGFVVVTAKRKPRPNGGGAPPAPTPAPSLNAGAKAFTPGRSWASRV